MAWWQREPEKPKIDYEVSPDGRIIATLQNKKTGQFHAIAGTPDDVSDEMFRIIAEDDDWEQVGVPDPMPKNFLGDDPPRDEYHSPSLFGPKEYMPEIDPDYEAPKRPHELQEERIAATKEEARKELDRWELAPQRPGQRSGPKAPIESAAQPSMQYRERMDRMPLIREWDDVKGGDVAPKKDEGPVPMRTPDLYENRRYDHPFESGWTSSDGGEWDRIVDGVLKKGRV